MTIEKVLKAITYLKRFNKNVDDIEIEPKDRISYKLNVERTVYFLQEFGAKIGYVYAWWSYGPYSDGFSNDIYIFSASKEKSELIKKIPNLNAKDKKVLKRCKEFMSELFQEREPKLDQEEYWLELACRVHFLNKYFQQHFKEVSAPEENLNKRGPKRYKKNEIEKVWNLLKKFELVVE